MSLFEVYNTFNIEPVTGNDCYVYDQDGVEYLDLYGGHAAISIGHSHPHYVETITRQLQKLGFYSNSVQNSLQEQLGVRLQQISGYHEHSVFYCNSGAEALENAMKLASFHTDRERFVAFTGAFHGRTSAAVAATDNAKIKSKCNYDHFIDRLSFGDFSGLENILSQEKTAAVLIECVQGVHGIYSPSYAFMQQIRSLCDQYGSLLICDEIQSGTGRTGKYFAHQQYDIAADIIPMAKGIANGFPMGAVMIAPHIQAKKGMLGSTFGGNHLACAAALAVLDVIEQEHLIDQAETIGTAWINTLNKLSPHIKEVRGKGLMIGIELYQPIKNIRDSLLYEHKIFTGSSAHPNVLRLLPPLTISSHHTHLFNNTFQDVLEKSLCIS